jgi:hypothetical protein
MLSKFTVYILLSERDTNFNISIHMKRISTVKCVCTVHTVPFAPNFMYTSGIRLDSTNSKSWDGTLSECKGWRKNITLLISLRARADTKMVKEDN